MAETIIVGSRSYSTNIRRSGSSFSLQVDDKEYEGEFSRLNDGGLEIILEGHRSIAYSEKQLNE